MYRTWRSVSSYLWLSSPLRTHAYSCSPCVHGRESNYPQVLRPGNTSDPLCPPACSEGRNVQECSANAISNIIFWLHTVVNADVSHGVPYLAGLASTLLCCEFDTHSCGIGTSTCINSVYPCSDDWKKSYQFIRKFECLHSTSPESPFAMIALSMWSKLPYRSAFIILRIRLECI